MENGAEVECEAPQDGQIKSNGVDGVDKSKSNDEPQAVAAENGSTDPDESSTPPVIDESQEVTTEDSPDPLAEPPELEKVPEANENGVDSSSEDPLKEDVEMSELKPETVDEQTMDAEQPKHVPSGKEPKEDEVPEDEASDDAAAEEQPSSTSSSPSALHIHLDEEDKDESLNGNQMFWFASYESRRR